MEKRDWLHMLDCLEELHHFNRALTARGEKPTLRRSELELLSLLYLHPEERTPLALSRRSGMKKEAVSRCLRQLSERGCIHRERHPQDERSFLLSLTEAGHKALEESYSDLLSPLYQLRREMGEDFERLFSLMQKGNEHMGYKGRNGSFEK